MTSALILALIAAASPAGSGATGPQLGALGGSPVTSFDRALVEHVMVSCPTNPRPKREIVLGLLAIEKAAGLPQEARGLVLAAACVESGFRPRPPAGDRGRSVGMFQFAGWAKRSIRRYRTRGVRGDVRGDWRASAQFWVRHVARQLPRVMAYCKGGRGYATPADMYWASANTTAVRAPACRYRRRSDGRCTSWRPRCSRSGKPTETLHWRTRAEWVAAVRRKLGALAPPAMGAADAQDAVGKGGN